LKFNFSLLGYFFIEKVHAPCVCVRECARVCVLLWLVDFSHFYSKFGTFFPKFSKKISEKQERKRVSNLYDNKIASLAVTRGIGRKRESAYFGIRHICSTHTVTVEDGVEEAIIYTRGGT